MEPILRAALEAGVRAVQLREKDLQAREFLQWAERLRLLTAEFGAKLIINDRTDICLAVQADGVHLRSDSMPIAVVRKIVGPGRLIGRSVHRAPEVIEAQREGADFVVLGPVYDTPSKRGMGRPLGFQVIREAVSGTSIPVFGIGGIRPERIPELLRSGAAGVAVVSAVLSAAEPGEAVERILNQLQVSRSAGAKSGH